MTVPSTDFWTETVCRVVLRQHTVKSQPPLSPAEKYKHYQLELQWMWSKSKLQNVSLLLLLIATSSYTHFEKYKKN